jgi:hypothetical protein
MKRGGILACILLAAIRAPAGMAQENSVDWKLYGGFPTDDGPTKCFFDAKGMTAEPDSHIRVWTKCLPQKEIDGIDIKKGLGGKVLENTAQKVANYYVPPIAALENVDRDMAMAVTQYEEIADIAAIQPFARIFYDIDCPQQKMRELSLYLRIKGKDSFQDKPSDWRYIPPEGNGSRLSRLLCPLK